MQRPRGGQDQIHPARRTFDAQKTVECPLRARLTSGSGTVTPSNRHVPAASVLRAAFTRERPVHASISKQVTSAPAIGLPSGVSQRTVTVIVSALRSAGCAATDRATPPPTDDAFDCDCARPLIAGSSQQAIKTRTSIAASPDTLQRVSRMLE